MTILIIHGVANRDPNIIQQRANTLQQHLPRTKLIPCYWGDLGAQVSSNIITTKATTLSISEKEILDQALARISDRLDETLIEAELEAYLRGPEIAKLRDLIRESDNAEQDLGNLIAEAYNLSPAQLDEIDTLGPRALTRFLEQLERFLRKTLEAKLIATKNTYSEYGFNFLGDALKYQKSPEPFWARIRETLGPLGTKENPVDVLAHSLGGVISFDMAMHGALWINSFVTLGSQAAFFDELVTPLDDKPLKPTINAWLNFYEPLDFLAYKAAKFTLHNGLKPVDIAIQCDRVFTHGCYWEHPTVLRHLVDLTS